MSYIYYLRCLKFITSMLFMVIYDLIFNAVGYFPACSNNSLISWFLTETVQSFLWEKQRQLQVYLRHSILRGCQERLCSHQWCESFHSETPYSSWKIDFLCKSPPIFCVFSITRIIISWFNPFEKYTLLLLITFLCLLCISLGLWVWS